MRKRFLHPHEVLLVLCPTPTQPLFLKLALFLMFRLCACTYHESRLDACSKPGLNLGLQRRRREAVEESPDKQVTEMVLQS